jgi:hypothetical protein
MPFDPSQERAEWNIPQTNLLVVFEDFVYGNREVRRIVTISFRKVKPPEKDDIQESINRRNHMIHHETKDHRYGSVFNRKPKRMKDWNYR